MEKKWIAGLVLIVLVFATAWFWLASSLTGWSDEITHMSVAQGLIKTGTYSYIDFDSGKVSDYYPSGLYTRGKLISLMTSLSYQLFGFSLLSARSVPLIFTVLIFLVFATYIKMRYKSGWRNIFFVSIFFFCQSMVLEKSLYVRMYAPLGLILMISLIFYWEGLGFWERGKKSEGAGFMAVAFFLTLLPVLDTWHYQQISIFFVAVIAGFFVKNRGFVEKILKHRMKSIIGAVVCCILFPFILLIFNVVISRLPVGNRIMGNSFITYWDNIAGLVRFALAANICLLGFFLPHRDMKYPAQAFVEWLFIIGLVSGLFTALYTPHNFIFYSRFFYLPILLLVLSFPIILSGSLKRGKSVKIAIASYVAINIALSFSNFYFERSNIRKPISWLVSNLGKEEVLLVFASELQLHGGGGLSLRAISVPASKKPEDIKKVIAILTESGKGDVYFLYTDHYAFRDTLYHFTSGRNRSPGADLFRFLRDDLNGVSVMSGLRGCGLKRFGRDRLKNDLQELVNRGYPDQFISPEVSFLRNLKRTIK